MTDYDRILIVGDFNVQLCCISKPQAKDFIDVLEAFNFVQHVAGPTQERGHTLDLIISHGLPIFNVQVCDAVFSDHMPVLFDFLLPGQSLPGAPVRYGRRLKPSSAADLASVFRNRLLAHTEISFLDFMDTEKLTSSFISTCIGVLDTIAPLKLMRARTKREPWLSDVTRNARRVC